MKKSNLYNLFNYINSNGNCYNLIYLDKVNKIIIIDLEINKIVLILELSNY